MRPANRPIAVYRGDTYQHLVTFVDATENPVDLTGYSYAAQLRTAADDPDVLAAMTADLTGAVDGVVWLTIDAAVTATLAPGRAAWDLEETDPSNAVTTILAGYADILPDVTRTEL